MEESLANLSVGISPGEALSRNNALANKITGVLSASFANADIRDVIEILDRREFRNTPETRRQFRLGVQKEVIDCNGEVITAFGEVAEVGHDLAPCIANVLMHGLLSSN